MPELAQAIAWHLSLLHEVRVRLEKAVRVLKAVIRTVLKRAFIERFGLTRLKDNRRSTKMQPPVKKTDKNFTAQVK
jgi:hypothetical protein